VPLLVTPSPYKQNAASLKKNNKVTNGNGLIDIIEHQQQLQPPPSPQPKPALMANNTTAAHVMRSRLNQYKTSSIILNFDETHGGTEAIIGKELSSKNNKKTKKKNSVADI
jgi:hypothetical protein